MGVLPGQQLHDVDAELLGALVKEGEREVEPPALVLDVLLGRLSDDVRISSTVISHISRIALMRSATSAMLGSIDSREIGS